MFCSPNAAGPRRLCKGLPSLKGSAGGTAILSSAHFRLSRSSTLPSVFRPLHPSPSLQVAASGEFPRRLGTVRHLGFGFCLLGARGELAEPIVCLHCSHLIRARTQALKLRQLRKIEDRQKGEGGPCSVSEAWSP